jgi:hypothetical protein
VIVLDLVFAELNGIDYDDDHDDDDEQKAVGAP